MSNIFLTSDSHFGDEKTLKYRYRPFKDVNEMNEEIVRLWNETVNENDIVYHLGDFAVTDEALEEFAPQLNGEIHLIMGNHDHNRDKVLLGELFDTLYFEPFELDVEDSDPIWVCHYPLQRHEELYSVFGHIHDLGKCFKNSINVSVDAWHFRVVPMETIINSRQAELDGYWDANVYPDADLEWQYKQSIKIKRSSIEPTLPLLIQKIKDAGREDILEKY